MIFRKPLNTTHHRFKAGDKIPEGADLTPYTLADLKARGFVGEEKKPDAEKPAALSPAKATGEKADAVQGSKTGTAAP